MTEHDIKTILDMMSLSAEERVKAENIFSGDFSVINVEESKDILKFLREQGLNLTKAIEVRLLCVPVNELENRIDILKGINEFEMVTQKPVVLCMNVLDIHRRIKYCRQNNITYRDEKGAYKNFLFSEIEWKKVINKSTDLAVSTSEPAKEVTSVTVSPEAEVETLSFSDVLAENNKEEEQVKSELVAVGPSDLVSIDPEVADSYYNTTTFDTIKDGLEDVKKELDELDTVGIYDIPEETFSVRR